MSNMGGHFLVFLIRTLKITFFVSVYISKTLLFIFITIYTHVRFSAQPSKFHYVIGGQLPIEIQSARILAISMSANTEVMMSKQINLK